MVTSCTNVQDVDKNVSISLFETSTQQIHNRGTSVTLQSCKGKTNLDNYNIND